MNFMWFCWKESEVFLDDVVIFFEVFFFVGLIFLLKRNCEGCYGIGMGKLRLRNGFLYIFDLDIDKMEGDEDYVIE